VAPVGPHVDSRTPLIPEPPLPAYADHTPRIAAAVVAAGLAACAVTAPFRLGAQQTRPLVEPPAFAMERWTTADGLPQNSVNAVTQTRDGYLWVGTFGGLARFDGTEFHVPRRSGGTDRGIDRVLALAEGTDGSLWIGTEDGLLRRRGEEWERYDASDGLPDHEVTAVHAGTDGAIWIGTARGGLARLSGDRFEAVTEVDGIPVPRVLSFVEGADGVVWANLAGGSFITIEDGVPSAARWRSRPLRDARHMVREDRDGARLYVVPERMVRVVGGVVDTLPGPDGTVMVLDPEDGYWLGTNLDGLYHIRAGEDGAAARHYPLPDGTAGYRIRSAHVDREGNVWVGTDAHGLLRMRRNIFTTYTSRHGLSHDVATALLTDRDGVLWAGTNCGGLNAVDLRGGTVRTFKPRMRNDPAGDPCLSALAEGPDGTLWAGTFGGGVTRIVDGREERLTDAGLPNRVVLALLADGDGTLWVGTGAGGLAAVEDGRVRAVYTAADGLAHDGVRALLRARDGALWIGTMEGLTRLHDGRFTTYTVGDGLSSGHVRAIHEDADGVLWIGTYGGGLNRFDGRTFTPITREDGLADDVVSAILEDDDGRLWMSGNRGVYRVDRRALTAFAEGRIERVHSVLYGAGDGLLNAETNGGFQPAGWKDADGRMWFPTLEGVAVVDPARVRTDGRPPAVALEAVVVDGETRPAEGRMVVGPGRPNVELHYNGLSLSHSDHLTFRYRLDGFDDGWVSAGPRRVAYYPRLPPGIYRFVVAAANRDGVWSAAGAAFELRVAGPFWVTTWFRAAVALAALGLLAGGLRWRESTARRERAAQAAFSRRLLESQEAERGRIARELHDGLGQELLLIKNRALLALRADELEAAAEEQLTRIDVLATRALANVRGMAHNLRPQQLEHLGLTAALEAMIQSVSDAAELPIDAAIDDLDGAFPAEAEINLYRVVQEGLNNVVRHARARSATVTVRRVRQGIDVLIADDGRGFDLPAAPLGDAGGTGLPGIAERVRMLSGRLRVASAPGRGTRIHVVVPTRATPSELAHTREPAPAGGAGA
jgi:signal transduction histidine kinase/ligand-binding sensor domain-containing protein